MIQAQRFAVRAALSGTVFVSGCVIGLLLGFGPPGIGNIRAAPIEERAAVEAVRTDSTPVDGLQATGLVLVTNAALTDVARGAVVEVARVDPEPPTSAVAVNEAGAADRTPGTAFSVSGAEVPVANAALPDPPPPRTLASLFTADPLKESPTPALRPVETPSECPEPQICIDDYLWSLYERAPKIDTNKVLERIKVTLKKERKIRTVTKSITKYVVGDFTWKDPIAARKAGMSLRDYVIGGMDPGFKLKLYRALRAMDDAGLMPGITSAFRDDYRQSIASGNKAASDSSYHGGSRRGGYGYGLAADLVSVQGETRVQRYASSQTMWKWIDAHEKELGIGRPYLDRDPPHVSPIDGEEYATKRGRTIAQNWESQTNERRRLTELNSPSPMKREKVSRSQARPIHTQLRRR